MAKYIDTDELVKHLEKLKEECGTPDPNIKPVAKKPVAYGYKIDNMGVFSFAQTLTNVDLEDSYYCPNCGARWVEQ